MTSDVTLQIDETPITLSIDTTSIVLDVVSSGGFDKHYSQAFTASSEITVNHNLGKRPAVTVADSAGDVCIGEISYTDDNSIVVTFNNPFTGTIYCN